jgi:hypothetical protein
MPGLSSTKKVRFSLTLAKPPECINADIILLGIPITGERLVFRFILTKRSARNFAV